MLWCTPATGEADPVGGLSLGVQGHPEQHSETFSKNKGRKNF